MSRPIVRVNTFFQRKNELNLDSVSKIFILIEMLSGINRLSLFANLKPILLALSLIISLSFNVTLIYLTIRDFTNNLLDYVKVVKLWQYNMCAVLAFLFSKRISNFYCELNTFDKETGFRGDNIELIKTLVQFILTSCFLILFFILLHIVEVFKKYSIEVFILTVIHIGELLFFGHLLSLLIPRLHFIGELMKLYFTTKHRIKTVESDLARVNDTFDSLSMKKLMNFYHKLIVAFDFLYDAIKWQMLIILVTSFISSLSLSFYVTLNHIRNDYLVVKILVDVMLAAIEILPMFAPCRVMDAVHGEAESLSELLSSSLYENKIEKTDRAVAQAMLALMEVRDMTFSLLRVFDINVSFPFKFLGLLVTYLIIMLQFDKVINIDRST